MSVDLDSLRQEAEANPNSVFNWTEEQTTAYLTSVGIDVEKMREHYENKTVDEGMEAAMLLIYHQPDLLRFLPSYFIRKILAYLGAETNDQKTLPE